jgi:hypothetical protein
MHVAALAWSNLTAKAAINFAFVAVLGGAAGLLWARARHRRELDMAALARFYDVYGRWFAAWKAWSALREGKLPKNGDSERGKLLKQAADAEGQFEALLIKIAIERRLSKAQVGRLGRFREAYQRLRECIEEEADLPFWVQGSIDTRSPYVAFKDLSVEFAALLQGRSWASALGALGRGEPVGRPTLSQGQEAFIRVTSWRVADPSQKDTWWKDPGASSVNEAVEAWDKLPYRQLSRK